MALVATNDQDSPDDVALARALDALPQGAPIVIMIHGFRCSLAEPATSPHRQTLSLAPSRRIWGTVSWPRRLGIGGDGGLAIALGRESRCSIWAAHGRAATAWLRLAALIATLRAIDPDRPSISSPTRPALGWRRRPWPSRSRARSGGSS